MKLLALQPIKSAIMLLIHLLVLSSLVLLSSCSSLIVNEKIAALPRSGFGGTGYKPSSGFGGTGKTSSGFGGTGIVGTVTRFGSIWVNGIEVDYGKNAQISSDLLEKDTLKLGQQVVLETLPLTDKTVTKKIHIYYPIAGEITHVSKEKITINHRYYIKTNQAKMDKDLRLEKGNFVAINGFSEAPQNWTATRISHNRQQKVFYHPVPKLYFSPAVKQVLIESTLQQLKQWHTINVNIKQLSSNSARLLFTGSIKNKRIQLHAIKSYPFKPHLFYKAQKLQRYKMKGRGLFQQQKNMFGLHRHQKHMRRNR